MTDPWLKEIEDYLVAQGVATADLISREFIPPSPTVIMCLHAYAGRPPVFTHDGGMTEMPGLQIEIRDIDSDHAQQWMDQAEAALVQVTNVTLGNTVYQAVRPLQAAFSEGWDATKSFTLKQNYSVERNKY